jgi:hypothetical protein
LAPLIAAVEDDVHAAARAVGRRAAIDDARFVEAVACQTTQEFALVVTMNSPARRARFG